MRRSRRWRPEGAARAIVRVPVDTGCRTPEAFCGLGESPEAISRTRWRSERPESAAREPGTSRSSGRQSNSRADQILISDLLAKSGMASSQSSRGPGRAEGTGAASFRAQRRRRSSRRRNHAMIYDVLLFVPGIDLEVSAKGADFLRFFGCRLRRRSLRRYALAALPL